MKAPFTVCLDACVLVPPALSDFLLSLASTDRLFRFVYSEKILAEVHRTRCTKFNPPLSEENCKKWRAAVLKAFPEGLVCDYQHYELCCTNDPNDRHVLAAAIKGNAELILTYNLKHFRKEDLAPHGKASLHPQDYLLTLFEHSPEQFVDTLNSIAQRRSSHLSKTITAAEILSKLKKTIPLFVAQVAAELNWDLS